MHICTSDLVFTLLLKILILISNKTLLDLYLLLSLGETHWKLFLNMERLSLIFSLVFRLLQLGQGLSVSAKDPRLEGGETLGRFLGHLREVFDPVVLDSVE